jgi:hypothetical protein
VGLGPGPMLFQARPRMFFYQKLDNTFSYFLFCYD